MEQDSNTNIYDHARDHIGVFAEKALASYSEEYEVGGINMVYEECLVLSIEEML